MSGPPCSTALYLTEQLLAQLHPLDQILYFIFSQISQWAGDFWIIRHKPMMTPETVLPPIGLGSWGGHSCCSLINLQRHVSMAQVEAQTLLPHVQLHISWSQDSPQILNVLLLLRYYRSSSMTPSGTIEKCPSSNPMIASCPNSSLSRLITAKARGTTFLHGLSRLR